MRLATVYMSRCCLLELPCKARSTAELEWLTRRAKSAPGLLASAGTVLPAQLTDCISKMDIATAMLPIVLCSLIFFETRQLASHKEGPP